MASWLYELADSELTAVYADSQDEKSQASCSSEKVTRLLHGFYVDESSACYV